MRVSPLSLSGIATDASIRVRNFHRCPSLTCDACHRKSTVTRLTPLTDAPAEQAVTPVADRATGAPDCEPGDQRPTARGVHMQCIAFAAPILQGKTDADRSAMQSVSDGERKPAHQSSRQRYGISREAVWIQPTPADDMAVVSPEARGLRAPVGGT